MATAEPKCAFRSGDVWTGNFRRSFIYREQSEAAVSFTFAADAYVAETTAAGGAAFSRWVPAGPNVVIQSFAESGDGACAQTDVAKYETIFNADCSEVTLEVVHDDCQRRVSLYTTMRLRKEAAAAAAAASTEAAQCRLSGQFAGIYPSRANSALAGTAVRFTFAPAAAAAVESSGAGSFFLALAAASPGAVAATSQVRVTDVGSQAPDLACPATQAGQYTIHWSADCDEVTLKAAVADECVARLGRLDELQLTRINGDDVKALQARQSYMI